MKTTGACTSTMIFNQPVTGAGLLTSHTTYCRTRTPLRPGTKLAVNWPEPTATPISPYWRTTYIISLKGKYPSFSSNFRKLRQQLERRRKYASFWNEKDVQSRYASLGIIFAIYHGGKWRLWDAKYRGKLKQSILFSMFVLRIGLDATACIEGQ